MTTNWILAFSGLLPALSWFYLTHQAAKCPKCSAGLLEGSAGLRGVLNLLRLTAGQPISCAFCRYETQARDYASALLRGNDPFPRRTEPIVSFEGPAGPDALYIR